MELLREMWREMCPGHRTAVVLRVIGVVLTFASAATEDWATAWGMLVVAVCMYACGLGASFRACQMFAEADAPSDPPCASPSAG